MSENNKLKAVNDLPQTKFSIWVYTLVLKLGVLASSMWILLVIAIIISVVRRYGFNLGSIFIEEMHWHFYAIGVSFALSYSMASNAHVRVDVLSTNFGKRLYTWIEILGILVLVIPYTAFVLYYSYVFVAHSFNTGEVSLSPGGIPYRWMIKSVMLTGFGLLLLTALARLSQSIACLRGGFSHTTEG